MSQIVKKGHGIEAFIHELLSHSPIPQTAKYIHREFVNITLQYIPGSGFVVGFQDTRVSDTVKPVMMFADAKYEKVISKDKRSIADKFRDAVMNMPVLSQKALMIETDENKNLELDVIYTAAELRQVMIEVCFQAEFLYDKNSRTLGQRPVFIQLNK